MCLWVVAETGKSLISYKEDIEDKIGKRFFYARDNVELTAKLKEKAKALIGEAQREQEQGLNHKEMTVVKRIKSFGFDYGIHEIITIDGLKLVFENGDWFCIRISGTENAARLYTETTSQERHESLRHICRALLDLPPEKVLSYLLYASEKQSKEQIPDENLYRMIGFENDDSRLGWVNPPAWKDVEAVLKNFLDLEVGRKKTQFIFSGMGGSINVIKALNNTLRKENGIKIHTIDSLDPSAIAKILSSIDDLSEILIIGISKSGTTEETLTLLSTLRENFQTHGLDYHNHFLWLTDLPQGRAKIENSGWKGVEILPIQTDGRTDIGGRFSAPHTTIFLLPLLLLLNKDLNRLETLWSDYVQLRKSFLFEPVERAYDLSEKTTQYFAIVLEKDLSALDTGYPVVPRIIGLKEDWL